MHQIRINSVYAVDMRIHIDEDTIHSRSTWFGLELFIVKIIYQKNKVTAAICKLTSCPLNLYIHIYDVATRLAKRVDVYLYTAVHLN